MQGIMGRCGETGESWRETGRLGSHKETCRESEEAQGVIGRLRSDGETGES